MPTVDLSLGPINYRAYGPDGDDSPVAVFVHGFLVNGTLWDPVAERLAEAGVRCIVPDWPLGAHSIPVPAAVALTPTSVARCVIELLEKLDLTDVVLVGNDTGGGLCQLALAGEHDRVGALVLTNCDAFEVFPPKFFVPLFIAARFRPAVWAVAQTTRLRLLRHSLLAFGPLLSRPRPAAVTSGWMRPALSDAAVRHDITRFARALTRKELVGSAEWLRTFDRPTRLVWGTRDRHFHVALARRLLEVLPNARLTEVADATTFVPIDRPDAVSDAIFEVAVRRTVTERRDPTDAV
ncbi:alpha/beta hydrolase [soil metagenome]